MYMYLIADLKVQVSIHTLHRAALRQSLQSTFNPEDGAKLLDDWTVYI